MKNRRDSRRKKRRTMLLLEPKIPRIPTVRQPTLPSVGGMYWYIVAKPEGKVVVLGPYPSQYEANTVAVGKLQGAYEVIALSTRDPHEAYRRVRHKILEDTGDLGQALRRMQHTV